MTDGQSGHGGEDSALICWYKSLPLGLKNAVRVSEISHAIQRPFRELETFTVTVLQGEDPHLSAEGVDWLYGQNLG